MNRQKEIQILIDGGFENDFTLNYVDKFEALKLKYEGDRDFESECLYWIAHIYHQNKIFDKSLDIFYILYSRGAIKKSNFFNALFAMLDQLIRIGRLKEAHDLFEKEAFSKEIIDNFQQMLVLLSWFVQTYDPTDYELEKYSVLFEKSANALGFKSDEKHLKDQIKYVSFVSKQFGREYGDIMIATVDKTKKQKIEILEKFISDEPPQFYKNLALKKLAQIKDLH